MSAPMFLRQSTAKVSVSDSPRSHIRKDKALKNTVHRIQYTEWGTR